MGTNLMIGGEAPLPMRRVPIRKILDDLFQLKVWIDLRREIHAQLVVRP